MTTRAATAVDVGAQHGSRLGSLAQATWFQLTALVLASALVRFLLGLGSPAPWVFPDEWIYSDLARNLASSGHFEVWGVHWPVRTFGPIYPIVLAPIYGASDSIAHAYLAVKALNAVAMSLAAVPAYLIARRVVSARGALFVGFLSLLVPAMVYTGKVMTENLAYPVCLAALLAIVRVFERPTSLRQGIALVVLAVSVATRAELVVLAPAYLTSMVLVAALEARETGRGRRAVMAWLAAYRLTLFSYAAVLGLGVTLAVTWGRGAEAPLGAHAGLASHVRLSELPRWLVYQLAELDLAVGIVPFAAFLLVGVVLLRRGVASPRERIFLAVASAVIGWFVLLAAAYETQARSVPVVFERYAFYVMPLLFTGMVLWLERGLPRPSRWTLPIAIGAVLLPAVLPYSLLLEGADGTPRANASTPGLALWAVLARGLGTHGLLVVAVLCASGLLAWLFVRASAEHIRLAVVLSLWCTAFVVAFTDLAYGRLAGTYRNAVAANWVDGAVGPGADVGAIWSGGEVDPNAPYRLAEAQFFNMSVRSFYDLEGPIKEGVPSQELLVRDGRLFLADGRGSRPLIRRYVLADATLGIVGTVVARDHGSGLVLYRIVGPVRIEPGNRSPRY
jgi:hypothetical protein